MRSIIAATLIALFICIKLMYKNNYKETNDGSITYLENKSKSHIATFIFCALLCLSLLTNVLNFIVLPFIFFDNIFVFIIGLAISVYGLYLLISSHKALSKNYASGVIPRKSSKLVIRDVYSKMRHPMYFSYICLLLGTGLLITDFIYFIFAVCISYSLAKHVILIEDNNLLKKFGEEFVVYKNSVNKFKFYL